MSTPEAGTQVTISLCPAEDVQVTVRSKEGFEYPHPERTFFLRPSQPMPIGRASSSAAKAHLASAPDNLFIDSPVISRDHAVLSTEPADGRLKVLLTDVGSMHGTFVNDEKLSPNTPRQLSKGDTLQFGLDITRNQDFFMARQWKFEYHPRSERDNTAPKPEPSFSRGFSVPEDSEDDMDMEIDELLSSSPAAGSQSNPVTIEDAEEGPRIVVLDPEEDGLSTSSEAEAEAEADVDDEAHSNQGDRIYFHEEPAVNPSRFTFHGGNSSDLDQDIDNQDDDQSVYSSDSNNDSHEYGSLSENGSMAISDLESASDSELSDNEAEAEDADTGDAEIARRMKLGAMLDHEHHRTAAEPSSSNTFLPPSQAAPPQVQHQPASTTLLPPGERSRHLSRDDATDDQTVDSGMMGIILEPYAIMPWDDIMADPPPPPRPAAPRPFNWPPQDGNVMNPFTVRGAQHHTTSWQNEQAVPSAYLHRTEYSHTPYRTTPFEMHVQPFHPPAPFQAGFAPPRPEQPVSAPSDGQATPSVSATVVNGVHTPPMPAADEPTFDTPQPHRRTKVSIPEIVENVPQQPPTPTSVSSLKRKADVLDSEEPAEAKGDAATSEVIPTAVTEPVRREERPKKKARTTSGQSAKKAAAAGIVLGSMLTAGAVGALLAFLPETFFQP
ncbi:hypothetical protein BS50DRAFT_569877 [Corynespora cassiicola Philippines]|uniref:FHA domain-containing protein n=1 Tax=Corynespora cassiicola Philippines TaxID=1448308 RepID=A0A2T2P3Z1_CORCC|nr:hypothetical protein BS50DRAFT_569877 [Corynespora cassiicola Philippines]